MLGLTRTERAHLTGKSEIGHLSKITLQKEVVLIIKKEMFTKEILNRSQKKCTSVT